MSAWYIKLKLKKLLQPHQQLVYEVNYICIMPRKTLEKLQRFTNNALIKIFSVPLFLIFICRNADVLFCCFLVFAGRLVYRLVCTDVQVKLKTVRGFYCKSYISVFVLLLIFSWLHSVALLKYITLYTTLSMQCFAYSLLNNVLMYQNKLE